MKCFFAKRLLKNRFHQKKTKNARMLMVETAVQFSVFEGFPGGSSSEEPPCHCRKQIRCRFHPWVRKIPWRRSGRSPGGGQDNPLQYSCLENPMDRGAWRATVYTVAESWTRLKRLNAHTHCCSRHCAHHCMNHLL